MTMTNISGGAISGRFYRLKKPPTPSCSLLDMISENRWTKQDSAGKIFHLGWCRPDPPYDGEIEVIPEKLIYADDGHGIWRCWIRQDTRGVGRTAIESMASSLATTEDPDRPLQRRQPRERRAFFDAARERLLKIALPQIKIIPVLLTEHWVWVGSRNCDDTPLKALLRPMAGGVTVDPVAWSPSTEKSSDAEGWNALSLATLLVLPLCDGNELALDVTLQEVTIKGDSIRVRSKQDALIVREAISTLTKAVESVEVSRLSFEVTLHGSAVGVNLDCNGLYRAEPAPIRGGFFHEGIKRRFDDALAAARRAGAVMRECRDRIAAAKG